MQDPYALPLFIVQAATLVALVVYVVATWAMASATADAARASEAALEEMRVTRQQQSRPYIVVYPDIGPQDDIELVIRNVGTTMATAITMQLSSEGEPPDFRRDIPAILQRGFSNIPPGVEHRYYWVDAPYWVGDAQWSLNLDVRYSSSDGEPYTEKHAINSWEYQHERLAGRNPMREIALEVKRLGQEVRSGLGSTGRRGPPVDG